MTTKRVVDLTQLTGAASATDDDFLVWDASAFAHKRISRAELKAALEAAGLVGEDGNGDASVTRDLSVGRHLNVASTTNLAGQVNFAFTAQINADSASGGKLLFNDINASGQLWQLGPGSGNASPNEWNLYNFGTGQLVLSVHKSGRIGANGSPTQAMFEAIGLDGAILFGARGTTKGARLVTSSSAATLEGVSSDLVTSYQPMYVGGSIVGFHASGTEICRVFSGGFRPYADATVNNGDPSYRWGTIYAATATINTSGRDSKVGIREQTMAERAWAAAILDLVRMYRLKDAVDAKGDAARWHAGVVVEDVLAAAETAGIEDPWRYGFLCADPVTVVQQYQVAVERPKVRKVQVTEQAVEIIDGRPVMKTRTVEREEPVGQLVAVSDENGNPVMVPTAPDAEGNVSMAPMFHFVPELEAVTETRTREVPLLDDASEPVMRYGLRYTELFTFILPALQPAGP